MLIDLDLKSVTGDSAAPSLDTIRVDIERVSHSSPIEAMKYLIAMRMVSIGSQFANFHAQPEGRELSPLVIRMYYPVNPLLLTTAISVSIVHNEDVSSFLENYALGVEIPGFEEQLLSIALNDYDDDLLGILELDDSFHQTLLDLGASILVKYGNLIEDSGTPTMLDLYWGCWLAVNPMFYGNPLPARSNADSKRSGLMNGWARAIKWGLDHNSAIHNAIEQCEYKLNEANRSINNILSTGVKTDNDRTRLEKATNQQSVATLLLERARRFYYWAPHEIDAHSAQLAYVLPRIQAVRDGAKSDSTIEHLVNEYQRFFLPEHILEQIDV